MPEFSSRRIARYERTSNAKILLAAQQAVRIIEPECKSDDRTHRRQGRITLFPGNAHAEHFLALPHAFTDDTMIGNRSGIRSRPRAGQGKCRDVEPLGQTRQVVILLFFSTVMHQ